MSNLITPEGVYGVRESGLIVPKEHAEIKVASPTSGIVLDPVCGSGTVADSAAKECRRVLGDYDWSFKEWNGVVEPVKQMWVQSR